MTVRDEMDQFNPQCKVMCAAVPLCGEIDDLREEVAELRAELVALRKDTPSG